MLKLSTMWEFTDIRAKAIQELSTKDMGMGIIEKVECARSFDVKDWLSEGYVEFLRRPETITREEAERLGWQTAAKLLLLREKYLSTINSQISTCGGCGRKSCALYTYCRWSNEYHVNNKEGNFTYSYDVQREFGDEL